MEKQKLIYVESKALFSPSSVSNKAIVFIKDTKEIWTHGTYFICSNIWATPITLTLSGDSTGSVSIDGSGNVTLLVENKYLTGIRDYNLNPNDAVVNTNWKIAYYVNVLAGSTNLFPAVNNANAILTLNTHDYTFNHQLGFSSNGCIYHRIRTAGTWETSWRELLTSTNYTNYPHTFASLTNKPTTISGYGITDSIPIIKGGEVTGNTDLSTLGMTTTGYKFSISYGYTSQPSWLTAYTNLFIFRASSDFYSGIATALSGGHVTFLGGRNAETTPNNVPNWWFRIYGTSGLTYNLATIQTAINNLGSTYLPLTGGTLTDTLILKAGAFTASNSNSYSGGRYQAVSKPNIRLIGDSTYGLSTIEFTSQKGDTSINKPSDSGFIQFQPYGVSALSSVGSHPTLKTSGESNALVLGVTNDSDDIIVLLSPNVSGLRHACGATEYYLPHVTTSTTTANKPLVSTTTAHVYTLGDEYLPLKGGTMTGKITLWSSNADAANTGGLNANNSNIYGLNSLYFADPSETAAEGINFYRSSTTVDSLWGSNGNLFWTPNRTYGLAGTNYYVLTSNNYSTHLNNTYLPLSGGVMTGLIRMTRGASYLTDTGSDYSMLGMINSGTSTTGMNSEEGMFINVPFTLATLRTSGNNLWHYNHANLARYLILDANNYTNYTINYAKTALISAGSVGVIDAGKLYYNSLLSFAMYAPDDNGGKVSYELIAELPNYGTGTNTSYVDYGISGFIWSRRGGNCSNSSAYPITAIVSIGPGTNSKLRVPVTTHVLVPFIVKYNDVYYLALRKNGSGAYFYFMGQKYNLLTTTIRINDTSLIEEIKGPEVETSTSKYYYNNGTPQEYLHAGNYSSYALPLTGGALTGNITVPSAFINTGDATLKFYSGKVTDAKSDGNICLLTSIDGTDGESHVYPTNLGSRCNLVLLPRGGQVYIGTNPDGGNTSYKLYVNGGVHASSLISDNVGIGTTSPSEKLEVNGNAIIGNRNNNGNLTIKSKMSGGVATLYFDNGVYSTDLPWKGYIAVSGYGDVSMRVGTGLNGNELCIHGMIFKLPRDIWGYSFRNNSNNDIAYLSWNGKLTTKLGYVVENGTSSQFLKADGSLDNNAYLPISGGTMTGALNFKNNTWNLVGDDVYIGDCNVGGMLGIKSAHSSASPGFAFYNLGGTQLGKLYADNSKNLYWTDNLLVTASNVNSFLYEANLKWGGRNISNGYSPIDASMIGQLGANRLAFINSPVSIEYSRDSGNTWADYPNLSNSQKVGFVSGCGLNLWIGADGSTNTSVDRLGHQLRVTLTASNSWLYTELTKFAIYIVSNGCACFCKVETRTLENINNGVDTWSLLTNTQISGYPAWNIINTWSIFGTGGGGTQHGLIRFTFYITAQSSTSGRGLNIHHLLGFGGMGWQTPSNMSRIGHIYSYDGALNTTFPAKVTASSFSGPLTGNVTGNVTGTATSANKANFLTSPDKRNNYPALIVTAGETIGASFMTASKLGISGDGSYYDALIIRGYGDSTGGNENAIMFSKNTSSVYHSLYAFGSTTTWGTLYKFLDSGNYKSYAPTLSGEGATGTWGINISGTANKVANALTLLLNSGTTSGTNKFVYDGSAAYTVNITPDSIGASATSHTHDYLPLSGGTMSANGYIAFPASANSSALGNSTPMGITYGRIHSYGTLTIAGDTDASKTEFVNIVAGRNISQATAANGLSIGYNTLKWQGTDISLAGHNHDGSYLKLSGGTLGSSSQSETNLYTLSSTAKLRLLSYSDSTNYILSGNSSFDGNTTLKITGYNNVTGTNLYFKFSNIYCRENDYINIDSGNYGSYALPLSGGTMTGAINTANIYPKANAGFNIGSTSNYYNTMYAYYFKKYGSDDNYLLLGGGGHKKISDFLQILDKGIEGGSSGNTDNWVLVLNNNYSTGWYGPCTMFYIRSKNFGCGILCFYHYWNTEGTSGYYDNSVWFFGAEHSAYSVTMGGIGRDINNYLKIYIDKLNADLKIYYNRYNNLALNVQELLFVHGPSGTLYPSGELRASHFINSTLVVELPTTSNTFVNIPILTVKNHTEDIKTTRSVYASAFYENSDIRLKENVHSIDLIDLLKNVDLVLFNFKNDLNKKYGVIAQQLEQVGLNNLVYEHNGNKAVDYISLLVLETLRLRNEIKELKEKLDKKELSS